MKTSMGKGSISRVEAGGAKESIPRGRVACGKGASCTEEIEREGKCGTEVWGARRRVMK